MIPDEERLLVRSQALRRGFVVHQLLLLWGTVIQNALSVWGKKYFVCEGICALRK